ncbi:MAG TPA: DUF4957 domain-containing protein [bacterium]|nr:DUF4957 domain-containing protein [bacterium]HPR89071.1 DUF4957 domain-containing protein [bacterium]
MKKVLLIVVSLIALTSLAFSQNYIDVAPGEGMLSAALAAAADGDVLRLVPGAEYTESVLKTVGTIVDKKIAIVADGDGSVKPIIKIFTDPAEGTCQFFQVGNNGSLLLAGLEFDGAVNGSKSVSYLGRCYMGESPAPAAIKKIHLESCVIANLKSNVIDGANSNIASYVVIDSAIVNNCIVHDTGTLVHFKTASSNYVQVTNSTMYNITSYGMRINGITNTQRTENPEVVVDHTTWYNIGLTDPREMIVTENAGTNLFEKPILITNSIFSTLTAAAAGSKSAINIKMTVGDAMATITHICMWDLGAKKNWLKHTITDTIRMDPGFADPANGDFTLPAGSLLLTYGSDKGPIGDKRWTNNASAVARNDLQPEGFVLAQNYPNPFNPATTISFTLAQAGLARLAVYDARGREVMVLAQGLLGAGIHHYEFAVHNLVSGLYFYRLTMAGRSWTKKMLLLQ